MTLKNQGTEAFTEGRDAMCVDAMRMGQRGREKGSALSLNFQARSKVEVVNDDRWQGQAAVHRGLGHFDILPSQKYGYELSGKEWTADRLG